MDDDIFNDFGYEDEQDLGPSSPRFNNLKIICFFEGNCI